MFGLTPAKRRCYLFQCLLLPRHTRLGEDRLKVTFEEGVGVLEVLFDVGPRGGDAVKRLVEDADDPPLLGKRGYRNGEIPERRITQVLHRRAGR
jgi:hypothetical protein